MTEFETVELAIEQIARGGIVIVLDALERENEGDFLAAADLITPETIHFMTTHGRGHLCLPVLPADAARFGAQPLVPSNGPEAPCFAMPLDSRECATGISPLDRALTIRSLVDPASRPEDFLRPGHVFPLIAREGGVLSRPGHTESAVDLTAMAGQASAGVLCEICSCDGRTMAGLDELQKLAQEYQLPIVTIDSLINYRKQLAPEIHVAESAIEVANDLSRATAGSDPQSTERTGDAVAMDE
jgi:3,4-dihydroxy 2-butanone 4-phosphate synthase/GTP cyclohydrolase II